MAVSYGTSPDKSIFPKTIGGLSLWLDANDSNTLFDNNAGGSVVSSDGTAIGRWQDKSGNNRHATQAIAASRPILKTRIQNNRNVIRFDGSNDAMNLASTISTIGTIFLVFKQISYKNYGVLLNAATNFGLHSAQSPDGNYQYPSDFMSNEKMNGQSITMPVWTNTTRYFDGIFQIFDTDTTGWNFQNVSMTGESVNGEYAEIIMYDSNLSDFNKNRVRDYLNSKWKIY